MANVFTRQWLIVRSHDLRKKPHVYKKRRSRRSARDCRKKGEKSYVLLHGYFATFGFSSGVIYFLMYEEIISTAIVMSSYHDVWFYLREVLQGDRQGRER
jgi:hypothetical protein